MSVTERTYDARPHLVDGSKRIPLQKYGVSFHWWGSEGTTLHWHNFYEFFLITEGRCTHELNGAASEIGKGTLCMICPNELHQLRRIDNQNSIHMNICILPEKLEAACNALGLDFEALCKNGSAATALTNDELSFFISRARLIGKLISSSYESAASTICTTALELLSVINTSRLIPKDEYPEWFAAIIERINSPEFITCSAADVYRMGNFSPPVMIEYFKKYTGKTVSAYLKEKKFEYACQLLKSTQLTTLEISLQLGYYSLSHFNRVFKGFSGISPAAYRKKFAEK